jgi:hypothetical protein
MATIGRRAYAEMFGPTVGDRCAWPTPNSSLKWKPTTRCAQAAMAKR